jgi:hypothetical protein
MAANGVRAILRKTLFRIALLVNCSIATAPVWAAGPTGAHANAYLFNAYPYYVEFRAAVDGVYGHSYIAYGRLNTLGQPASAAYADIHPIGGFTSMVLGHFFALQASTSPEKDTLGHKIASRFRLPLTATGVRQAPVRHRPRSRRPPQLEHPRLQLQRLRCRRGARHGPAHADDGIVALRVHPVAAGQE